MRRTWRKVCGQKQRLGIRAFYIDAEILIFDEFTNFLDANNEQKIINEVSMLKGKKLRNDFP